MFFFINTENLEKDLNGSTTYTLVDDTKNMNILKKHVQEIYKRGPMSNVLKGMWSLLLKERTFVFLYLIPADVRQGKIQGNQYLGIIVNGSGHPTERVAELVEVK